LAFAQQLFMLTIGIETTNAETLFGPLNLENFKGAFPTFVAFLFQLSGFGGLFVIVFVSHSVDSSIGMSEKPTS
jgi:hypothetical protein